MTASEAGLDLRVTIERWASSPFDFVLEAFFRMTSDQWTPWDPSTPRPSVIPDGPDLWQGNLLKDVGKAKAGLMKRKFSVRAGHGVGKTTIEAWLILWFVLFHRDLKVPVTANSQDQLRDVLWAEIAKWHRQLPPFLKELVEVSSERVLIKSSPNDAFAVARTAREERPEALQGFHAGTLAFFLDEASGIPDIIFEVAGGALSSDDVWMFMFSNPTRLSGYFYRSNYQNRDSWNVYHIPCQHAVRVSDSYAADVAAEYGEQTNVYRIRVLGEFPLEEDNSVISLGLVEASIGREISHGDAAMVWGLDVARFGDDATALCKRWGGLLIEPTREWKKLDLMQTCGIIAAEYRNTPIDRRPSSINVDVIGLGGGVVDRLQELGLPVHGINVGEAPATDDGRYMRLRDELWFKAREWFYSRAVCIPKDDALISELVVPKYKIESSGKIKVESKDEMKKRGARSPNRADALCLTFAGGDMKVGRLGTMATTMYDPFSVGSEQFERELRQATSGQDWVPF